MEKAMLVGGLIFVAGCATASAQTRATPQVSASEAAHIQFELTETGYRACGKDDRCFMNWDVAWKKEEQRQAEHLRHDKELSDENARLDLAQQRYLDCVKEKEERSGVVKDYMATVEKSIAASTVKDKRTIEIYREHYQKYADHYVSTCKNYGLPQIAPLQTFLGCYNEENAPPKENHFVQAMAADNGAQVKNRQKQENRMIARCVQTGRTAANCYNLHHSASSFHQDYGDMATLDAVEHVQACTRTLREAYVPEVKETARDFLIEDRNKRPWLLKLEAERREERKRGIYKSDNIGADLPKVNMGEASPEFRGLSIVPERAVRGVY